MLGQPCTIAKQPWLLGMALVAVASCVIISSDAYCSSQIIIGGLGLLCLGWMVFMQSVPQVTCSDYIWYKTRAEAVHMESHKGPPS